MTGRVQGDDRPREACGVVGIFAPGADVARLAFVALCALQHRGQESAGIATCHAGELRAHKAMGRVGQVFDEAALAPLIGASAIGHTRYSTAGTSTLENAQPCTLRTPAGPLAVAHNGHLTNAAHLRRRLRGRGVTLRGDSDSEVIAHVLAGTSPHVSAARHGRTGATDARSRRRPRSVSTRRHPPAVRAPSVALAPPRSHARSGATCGLASPATAASAADRWGGWRDRIRGFMDVAEGAYALTVLTCDAVYAVRDAYGFRPLCLGRLRGGEGPGWVVASESCALSAIGAELVREVAPGEIVRLDAEGVHVDAAPADGRPRAACSFEHVYFARPESRLEGRSIRDVRRRMGRELARESPAPEADLVIGVPESSFPAAQGFAGASGLPFREGLVKHRGVGRTFIAPTEPLRRLGIRLKFDPLAHDLEGRRVVMVDDSIVRGHTSAEFVRILREAGAREVHVRVSSPPVRHPCFMGVDMPTHEELIADRSGVEAIRARIGADSLAYLSLEGLMRAIGATSSDGAGTHCSACFSGRYPIPPPPVS